MKAIPYIAFGIAMWTAFLVDARWAALHEADCWLKRSGLDRPCEMQWSANEDRYRYADWRRYRHWIQP